MITKTQSLPSTPIQGIGVSIARGTAWMMLFKWSERSIGLISTLILARLLTPADFGLVAMAMSVVALMELMGAFGFDTALIQRQDAQRTHYDTAWTFNVLFSITIALLLLVLAFPAASFYREPQLQWILPVLAIGALVQGFENIGTVNFRKELNFRREFRFLLSTKVASFAITVGLALSFRNYWALVAGIVTGKLFSVWLSYRLHPYRPRFTLAASHDLFHFSKWLFFSNLVIFLQAKSADFIIGRTVGSRALGIYNIAFEIAVLPSTELVAPLNRAVYPVYSRISKDLTELRCRFLEVFGIIALISFPISIGLACVATPAVLVLLGNQWVEAIPLLRIFTIAGLVGALQSNLHLVIVALGKPKANTLVSTFTVMVSLPIFIFASLHYGVIGAAWTYLIFAFVGLSTIQFVFFHITAIPVSAYMATLWRPILSSIALALAVLAAEMVLEQTISEISNLLKLLILVFTGAITYIVAILITWWISGKPQSTERVIINFFLKRLQQV
ncbi:MAG: lipopolysaccharide biosynthesis protein [Candidatus Competibacteraceae bacterium]|nr:lipopolysaccharide biosynthesis protein [Candidatus Competibacteraceae bacterium]